MTPFSMLSTLAEEMAHTASRLKKRAAIAQALRAAQEAAPRSDDAGILARYLSGAPFAEADSRKLNAGGALLSKVLLQVSGATEAALTAAYRRHGDLGAAAFDLLEEKAARERDKGDGEHAARPVASESGALTLEDVADAFAGMAAARTTATRAALVEGLLRRATPLEAKYLLKLMLGDMRIGVKQSLVEEAIAAAAAIPGRVVRPAEVRHAVMLEADLAAAVRRAFDGTLADACMRLFHPLGFMLASPVDSPEEAVERFSKAEKKSSEPASQRVSGEARESEDKIRRSPSTTSCAVGGILVALRCAFPASCACVPTSLSPR